MTPKERREIKRRVRARIVAAAARSSDRSVFAYSRIVTDPRPAICGDRRRTAHAHADIDTERVVISIYDHDILRQTQVYLRLMVNESDLRLLDQVVWHPANPCSPLIALAMVMVE